VFDPFDLATGEARLGGVPAVWRSRTGSGRHAHPKTRPERPPDPAPSVEGAFPVTVLRAGMVHGVGSAAPREWYFVKRALDRRRVRLLAYRGGSRCHPTATINLAELIRLAAIHPGNRVPNAGDPRAPTVREIAAHIDAVLGQEVEEVLLDGPPEAGLG
jgi:nucleoside-diphosphate-sugar epimerase